MWHDNVLGTIGHTPMVRLNRVAGNRPFPVVAKIEFFNPGGSVKDRIGLSMVEAAEADGSLKPGGTIIEGTSGLIVCPTAVAPEDPRSYYSVAKRLATEIPNSVYLNQYDNPANTAAHIRSTGPELWDDTDGRITHFISTAGTGGTISGCARYLKEKNPDIKVVGIDPFGSVYHKYFFTREFDQAEIYPYLTEGVGEDILAGNMDFDLVDDYVRVTDRESMLMTRRLAREEGLFVGQSCGMAVAGAVQWLDANAESLKPTDVVVVLLPDSGFRYLSKTYNDNWMRNHGFVASRPDLTVAQIVSMRRREGAVISVAPESTLGDAIALMNERDISQLPVIDNGSVVGSLTETTILNALIERPDARHEAVNTVMAAPFPIVSDSLHLDHLSTYMDQPPGAVLVQDPDTGSFRIITKSDLIGALSRTNVSAPSRTSA